LTAKPCAGTMSMSVNTTTGLWPANQTEVTAHENMPPFICLNHIIKGSHPLSGAATSGMATSSVATGDVATN
jgi:hypothetical protein